MDDETFRAWHGWAEIGPKDPVVAGNMGAWKITYHVGRYGIDDGGGLKIAWRQMTDWGRPQMRNSKAANYLSVTASGNSRISYRFDPRGHIRPWRKALVIDFADTPLGEGDTVEVVYGDTSQGSPGMEVQTFCEKTFEFKVFVDSHGGGEFVELRNNPEIEVIGGAAAKLVMITPSMVKVGEPFDVVIKALDKWGNVAPAYTGSVTLSAVGNVSGLPGKVDFAADDKGIKKIEGVKAENTEVRNLSAKDANGLACTSNPIWARDELPKYRPFWGDLHGQSEETVGTNSVEDYFRYARDVSFLDFTSHQGNAFQITKETWEEICRCAKEFNKSGEFVTFLGYEWSGNTPAGGDHNVYFLKDDEQIHRCSHWQIADKSDADTDRFPVTELYATLKERDAITIPHVGGRPANLELHDPEVEPLIEIYSAWGQFEWFLREALERGHKVGFVAGSDDHKGRPGASDPGSSSFGVHGGLVCVLAEELTREAIWDALKNRRCYATSGQRILLEFSCGQYAMGEWCEVEGPPEFEFNVAGTDNIEKVELFAGGALTAQFPAQTQRESDRIRITWGGALIKGRGRIATWDGEVEIEGGKITDAQGYAFDSAAEGITQSTANRVEWKSTTAGDVDGIIVRLDAADDARLKFKTPIVQAEFSVGDVRRSPVVKEAGGVGLRMQAEFLPRTYGPLGWKLIDNTNRKGLVSYYIRVMQRDGATAWSSPIYVNRT